MDELFFKGYVLILLGLILSIIPNSFLPYYVKTAMIFDPEFRIEGEDISLTGFLGEKIFFSGKIFGKEVQLIDDQSLNLTIPISNRNINVTCHLTISDIVEPSNMRSEVKLYDGEIKYCALIVCIGNESNLQTLWSKTLRDLETLKVNLKCLESKLNVTPPYSLVCKACYEYKIETDLIKIGRAWSKEFNGTVRPIIFWKLTVEREKLTVNYFKNYSSYIVPVVNPMLKSLRDYCHIHQILIGIGVLIQGYSLYAQRKARRNTAQ